ncbi:hypothetical protein GTP56_03395 [Duganella sp. FT134W]|uniref:HEPN domain-containing protein n=1 Tax=Duganella margarita TaxID=2692170 RepID=A0A7X4GY83_9BURK|nr:hypothetical protein [Duganella margarita]MYM71239.1 hypothetical protein [Duganella margarita]
MNPTHILNTSKQFFLAAKRADEQRIIGGTQFEWLPVPAIVCAAFSIELALKAIIMVETGKSPRVHLLDDLYAELSLPSQKKVAAAVTVPTYPKVPGSTETFDTALTKIRNAFVDWRYIHEKTDWTSIDRTFLMEVADAVQAVAASAV